jgi:hypothetical protein
MLVGVRSDTMNVLASSDGEYHINLTICNKADNFIWNLVLCMELPKRLLRPSFYVN